MQICFEEPPASKMLNPKGFAVNEKV